MRNLVYLPVDLIKAANNENWLRSLAYFVRLKSLYRNNTHYHFTLRSLAERLQCSPACLSVHLKTLQAKDLVRYHGGNVTFAGLKKLQGDHGTANIGVPVLAKNQYDILRGQIIRFNLSAQSYNIRKSAGKARAGFNLPSGIQKRKQKSVPFDYTEKTESCYTGLSAKGTGLLFSRSLATGARIRQKLKDLHQLSVNRVYSVLHKDISRTDYFAMKWTGQIPAFAFYRQGRICVERRCEMEYTGHREKNLAVMIPEKTTEKILPRAISTPFTLVSSTDTGVSACNNPVNAAGNGQSTGKEMKEEKLLRSRTRSFNLSIRERKLFPQIEQGVNCILPVNYSRDENWPAYCDVLSFFNTAMQGANEADIALEAQKFIFHYDAIGWKSKDYQIRYWKQRAMYWITKGTGITFDLCMKPLWRNKAGK